jgi:hypothetical protein
LPWCLSVLLPPLLLGLGLSQKQKMGRLRKQFFSVFFLNQNQMLFRKNSLDPKSKMMWSKCSLFAIKFVIQNEACGNYHVNTIQMQSTNIRQRHTITIGLEYNFVGAIHSMHMWVMSKDTTAQV